VCVCVCVCAAAVAAAATPNVDEGAVALAGAPCVCVCRRECLLYTSLLYVNPYTVNNCSIRVCLLYTSLRLYEPPLIRVSAYTIIPGKHFQPSLMFVSKANANVSEEPFRCSTLGQAPGLICKHKTKAQCYKTFLSVIYGFS
jgi:hypothetical protein